jgi:hypothetical protein
MTGPRLFYAFPEGGQATHIPVAARHTRAGSIRGILSLNTPECRIAPQLTHSNIPATTARRRIQSVISPQLWSHATFRETGVNGFKSKVPPVTGPLRRSSRSRPQDALFNHNAILVPLRRRCGAMFTPSNSRRHHWRILAVGCLARRSHMWRTPITTTPPLLTAPVSQACDPQLVGDALGWRW